MGSANPGNSMGSSIDAVLAGLVQRLPSVLVALALLLLGWLIARLLRAVAVRGAGYIGVLMQRRSGGASPEGMQATSRTLGALVFWTVLLVFLALASDILGLGTLSGLLAKLLDYLPTLAAGLLIVAAGFLLSRLVGELAWSATPGLESSQRVALRRLAQVATLVAALVVGADQMGIRVTWVALLLLMTLATILGGAAVAMSLGARNYVANLIGAFYLRQAFQVGQSVRASGFQGRILDLTATSLVLEIDEGRVVIPARVYLDEPVVLLAEPGDG
ncbi:MAG: hypothetical protein AB7Q97_18270 [Gammaproteobacteria bacterium]